MSNVYSAGDEWQWRVRRYVWGYLWCVVVALSKLISLGNKHDNNYLYCYYDVFLFMCGIVCININMTTCGLERD